MANDQPHAAASRPRAPSAPPTHGRARAPPDASCLGHELLVSFADEDDKTASDGLGSSHPNSAISIGGGQLADAPAPAIPSPARPLHRDAESLPLVRKPSHSPRRHASHRISHLIDSVRHLHVQLPHVRHDRNHPQSPVEPNSAHSRLLAADSTAASPALNRPSGEAAAAVPPAQSAKSAKLEKRTSFRKSWDPSMSSKMRESRSPLGRRLSMRVPASFSTSPPPPPPSPSAAVALHHTVDTIEEKGKERSSSRSPAPTPSPSGVKPRVSRSKQRSDKASSHSSARPSGEKPRPSSQSNSQHEQGERERREIDGKCRTLGLDVIEMSSDGHCLYAAVADQLNVLAVLNGADRATLTYKDTRKAAAATMRADPDTYMPFISDSDEKMAGITNDMAGSTAGGDQSKFFLSYCDAVERTSVWGGQPEILALSRAYRNPIVVLQAGTLPLKFGEEFSHTSQAYLAYYRAAYGLGEHFNSLRPYKYRSHAH